ncbi:hypothetical protein Tco_1041941 [Tanacetum coccineum]|uniref:Uncharacterized protein n=1 Tax=Tanacetum coccineum TaxID=301880 RepID=A0ABQ5GI41_9ASTR
MSSSTHPIIILSDSNVEDVFPLPKHLRPFTTASTDIPSLTEIYLFDPFRGSYLRSEQIRNDNEIVLARVRISTIVTLEMTIEDIRFGHRSEIKSLLDTEPCNFWLSYHRLSRNLYIGLWKECSRHLGSSSPVRSTTPPPDYPFDETIFVELDNSLWIIPLPLISESDPEKPNEYGLRGHSTSANTRHDFRPRQSETSDDRIVAAALDAQSCLP